MRSYYGIAVICLSDGSVRIAAIEFVLADQAKSTHDLAVEWRRDKSIERNSLVCVAVGLAGRKRAMQHDASSTAIRGMDHRVW